MRAHETQTYLNVIHISVIHYQLQVSNSGIFRKLNPPLKKKKILY